MYECMHRPFIIPTLRHPPQPPHALIVAATDTPRRDSACDTHEALQHNSHPTTTIQSSHVSAVCNAQNECDSLSSTAQLQHEREACTQDEMTHSGIASPPAEAVSSSAAIVVSGHRGRDEEEAPMRGSGGAASGVRDGVACRDEDHTLPAYVSHDSRSGEAVEDDVSGHVQRTQARLREQQPHYLPPLFPSPLPAMSSLSIAHPFTTPTAQCHAGQHTHSGLFTTSVLSHSDDEEDDTVRRADATSVAVHHRASGDADIHAERQTSAAAPSTQALSFASLRLMAHVTYRGTLLRRSFALWWRVSLARRRRRRQRERFAAFFYGERLCFVAFRAWQWRCALRWRLARLRQSVQAEHCLWLQRRVLRAWHATVQQRHRQREVVKKSEAACAQRCRRVYWHRWLLWQRQCAGLRALQCAVKQSHQTCVLRRWCTWLQRRQYNTMCMMVLTLHTPAAWSMTSTTTSVTLTISGNGLLREENMRQWSLREWCMIQYNSSSSSVTQADSFASHSASPPQLALCSSHHSCTSTPTAAATKHTMSSLTCAATDSASHIHNATTTATIGKERDGTLYAMTTTTRIFLAQHVWLQWLRVTWARRGQRLHRHVTLLSELQRRTGKQRRLLTWRTWLLFTMVALRRRRVQRTLGQHDLSRWMRWSALERQCRTWQQRQVQLLGAQCLTRWQTRMHTRRVQHAMHDKAMHYYTETWCVHEAGRVLRHWYERLMTRSSQRAMRDDAETLRGTLLQHIALRRLIERVMTSALASRSAAEATTTTIGNTRDVWPVMAQEQSSQRGSRDRSNTASAVNVVTVPLQTAWHTTRLPSPIPLHTLPTEGESAKTTQEHIAYKDYAAAAAATRVRGNEEHTTTTSGSGMTCPKCHTALVQPRIQNKTRRQGRLRQGMSHNAIHVCARCAEEREEDDDDYRSDDRNGAVMRARRHIQGDAVTQTCRTPTQSSSQEQHYERQGTTCDGRVSVMHTSRTTTTTAVARRTRMSDADTQTDIQDAADEELCGSNKIAMKNTAVCATETLPPPPSSSAMPTHGMTHESTALPPLIAHDAERMSRVSDLTDGAAQPRIVYVPLCLAPPTGQEDNNNSPTTTSNPHPCVPHTVTNLPCSSPTSAAVRQAPLPQPNTATEAIAADTSCHAALAPSLVATLSLSPPAEHNAALSKAVCEMPVEAQVRAYLQALAKQGTLLPCASHARCGFDLHKHVDPCAPLPTTHTDTTTQPSEFTAHTAPLITSSPSFEVQQQQRHEVSSHVATSAVGQGMSPAPPLTRTDSIHASPCAIVTGIQRTQSAVPQQAGLGGRAAEDIQQILTSPDLLLPHNGNDAVVEDAEELSSVRVLSELSELDSVALVQQGRQLLQQYKLLKRLAPAHEAELRTIEQQLHTPLPSSMTEACVASMQALRERQARLLYYRAQRTRLRSAVEQLAMRLQDRLGVHLSFSDTASEH